jgi:hypothetical protein
MAWVWLSMPPELSKVYSGSGLGDRGYCGSADDKASSYDGRLG